MRLYTLGNEHTMLGFLGSGAEEKWETHVGNADITRVTIYAD